MRRFPAREGWARLFCWLSAAGLVGLLAREIRLRGPFVLSAPASPVARTQPAMEEMLRFLRQVSIRAPRGASVAIVEGEQDVAFLSPVMIYFLALGQLPEQRVLYADSLPAAASRAEYVGVYGGGLSDSRLRLVARVPEGALYRKVR